MLKFEDRASEKGLRLVGIMNEIHIEIGLYYPFGNFHVSVTNEGLAKFYLKNSFLEVVKFITENWGENNLDRFEKKANFLYVEMNKDKYVKKWKKELSQK